MIELARRRAAPGRDGEIRVQYRWSEPNGYERTPQRRILDTYLPKSLNNILQARVDLLRKRFGRTKLDISWREIE